MKSPGWRLPFGERNKALLLSSAQIKKTTLTTCSGIGYYKFDFQVTYLILILVVLLAGLLSGAVGFGGGMVMLPVITYFYGVEVAVPVSTIAQLVSNLARVGMGWKQISWKAAG